MRRAWGVGCFLAILLFGGALDQAQPKTKIPADTEGGTYSRYAEGLFARRVFSAPSPERDYVVEVWRFSVPPATKSAEVVLPGAAAVVVRLGGVVVVTRSNQQQKLGLGGSVLLAEGERVTFINQDRRRPANLRVVIFRGEGKP